EAERCDRISLMHAGKVLVSDSPAAIVQASGSADLEEAFVSYLKEALDEPASQPAPISSETPGHPRANIVAAGSAHPRRILDWRRIASIARRETLELCRDPIRASFAFLGSLILLFVIGYGLSMDIENLPYAVLDHDQTTLSRSYTLDIAGSRYFTERP